MEEQDERLVTSQNAKDRIKQNLYYVIIGIISFLSVAFLPILRHFAKLELRDHTGLISDFSRRDFLHGIDAAADNTAML